MRQINPQKKGHLIPQFTQDQALAGGYASPDSKTLGGIPFAAPTLKLYGATANNSTARSI
jgi:hypothetical protein